MRLLFCTAFQGKGLPLVNVMSGSADREDLQPESHKIQIMLCQTLPALLKSNISLSLNILEKEIF